MKIRYATTDDAVMLAELGAKTFYETFTKDNTPENMESYLKASFSPEIQRNELSAAENIFLIAESDDRAVGYAQLVINSRDEAIRGAKPLEIKRIYAIQEYIGMGVGKELMVASLQEARQRDCDSVWLGVWEKNLRAIRFYKKWGFREVGTHIFPLGEELQRDFIMELQLAQHLMGE